MTSERFVALRSPSWRRMEALLSKAGSRGAAALTGGEIHELLRAYPTVAVDVARARLLDVDPAIQRRINALAIAAHGLLYRRKHVNPFRAIGRFFARDYPRLFRRQAAPLAISLAIFATGALGAYVTVRLRPATAYVFVPRGLDMPGDEVDVTDRDVSERYRRMPKPPMATGIMANNLSVAFLAFALGITAGVGTGYVLLVNSLMLGAFFAHFDNHGLTWQCYSFLVPHGVLEVFAVLVAAAAGLRLGLSLAVPGRLTRGASLRAGARQAVGLVLGTIPMFVVAGAIEAFVTPAYGIAGGAKIALGLFVGAATLLYLLLSGRREANAPVTADAWT